MLRKGISRVSRRWRSTELAAAPFVPAVNASHVPTAARLPPVLSGAPDTSVLPPVSADHWDESWGADALASAHESNVVATWGPTKAIAGVPMMVRGEGVYLYDAAGKEYIDWTSQAICVNLGHSPPPAVQEAVARQLNALPFVYGGLAATEPRARLAALLSEVMPADLNGFLFPSGGAEANEAAVRVARRYTGRRKVLSMYRSYHGGTSTTLAATGDFRRNFDEATAPTGFVKMVNPTPLTFKWAEDDSEGTALSLAALEEQIIGEGPETIAAIMAESVVGSGGVFVHPPGYMQGVRALCDRYGIVLIMDEVMAGFGRTGKMWGFQHYDGVVPDIVTSAKGLTGSYLPLAMVALREPIRQHFVDAPLGWGSTFQAHPVALACAYECVKHLVKHDLPGHAANLEEVMLEWHERLVESHPSVLQARAVGLFGCLDLVDGNGAELQPLSGPTNPAAATAVGALKKALIDEGVHSFVRAPYLHTAPPLIISEEELRDGFGRIDRALDAFDDALGL
jgi:adenosylmethionine-8-amino-7-oxononanoate aminotransferase